MAAGSSERVSVEVAKETCVISVSILIVLNEGLGFPNKELARGGLVPPSSVEKE